MAKTTKTQFEYFKGCAEKWQKSLGLVNWSLYFEHAKLEDVYARTHWSTNSMIATIQLAKDWDNLRPISDKEIDRLALHEILHVLLAPLVSEAEYRYSSQEAIDSAEHSIVRTLENICV